MIFIWGNHRQIFILVVVFLFILVTVTGSTEDLDPDDVRIVVDTYGRTLSLYLEGELYKTYPIAIGKPDTKTPIGEWAVINKMKNWEGRGALGTRWLGLNVPWGSYGIHGTNQPGSIGTAASGGCVRMHNLHVEELYELVPVKTRVKIIGHRVPISVNRILRPGAAGLDVMQLQDSLQEAGFEPSFMDAHFGSETEKSVRELQAYYGLEMTGIADSPVLYILNLPEEGKQITGGVIR